MRPISARTHVPAWPQPPPAALAVVLMVVVLAVAACPGGAEPTTTAVPTSATTAAPLGAPTSQSTGSAAAAAASAMIVVQGQRLQRTKRWKAAQVQRQILAQNPLAGREWGVYHGGADQAWGPYLRSSGTNRALLATIVEEPKAQWFGGWIAEDQIASKVGDYIANAQDHNPDKLVQMAVFRMQPWEHESCRRLPSVAEQTSYKRWIDSFAAAVGDTPAAIILQPDGPFALCAPGGSQLGSSLIAYSAKVFSELPNTATYIDAGAADWPAVGQGGTPQAVKFLIPAGIEYVRGIALNSTHYSPTTDEVQRGADIVRALAAAGIKGKKVVVNTSSNGRGFVFGDAPGRDRDNATVCASMSSNSCVTLGIAPTTDVADPAWGLSDDVRALAAKYVDAYLWFGRPWLHRQNSPFDLARALQLARTTPY